MRHGGSFVAVHVDDEHLRHGVLGGRAESVVEPPHQGSWQSHLVHVCSELASQARNVLTRAAHP